MKIFQTGSIKKTILSGNKIISDCSLEFIKTSDVSLHFRLLHICGKCTSPAYGFNISSLDDVLLQKVKTYQSSYHVLILLEEETQVYPDMQPPSRY